MIGEIEANWVLSSDLASRIDAEYYQRLYIEAQTRLNAVHCVPFHTLWNNSYRIYMGIKGHEEVVDRIGFTPYLRPVDIDDFGFVNFEQLGWCDAGWLKDYGEQGTAKPNDLIVEVKGNTRKVAILPAKVPENCVVSGSAWRIQVSEKVDNRYIQAFLLSDIGQILKRRQISNSIIPWINPEAFRKLSIPLPDLKVQAYIGNKVRLAEKCRKEANSAYNTGQQLLDHSLDLPIIHEEKSFGWYLEPSKDLLFGRLNVQTYKPAYIMASRQLSERSDCHSLGSLIGNGGKDIAGGSTPLGASYPNGGVPFLRVQNVQKNYLDLTDVVYIDISTHSAMKRSQVNPYDVVFTITGYPGSAACVTPDQLPLNMNQHSVRFSVCRESVDPFYLASFLNSDYGFVQVKQRATGATRDALDYPSIKSIIIPILDFTLQKQIGFFFRQHAFYRHQSEVLIQEAKSDVELLIDGRFDTQSILSGIVTSPMWESIENQKDEYLRNYD